MKFVKLSEVEYLEYEKAAKNTNFFTGSSFIKLQKSLHRELHFVGVSKQETIVAACMLITLPVKRFFKYMYAPRNFLVDFNDYELLEFFTDNLKVYCKGSGAAYMLTDPYYVYEVRDMFGSEILVSDETVINNLIKVGFSYGGKTTDFGDNQQQFRFMFSVDCRKSYDELFNSPEFKARRNINRAKSLGVEVREIKYEELDVFYDIVTSTSETRGFTVASLDFYQKQFKAYGEDLKVLLSFIDVGKQITILEQLLNEYDISIKEIDFKITEKGATKPLTKKRKTLVQLIDSCNKRLEDFINLEKKHGNIVNLATGMFTFNKSEVCYLASGYNKDGRNLFGMHAIQNEVLRMTYDRKIPKFNMYGISGTFDENDPAFGVYKFKQGFTGNVEVLVGDFELVCSSFKYRLLKLLRG